MVHLSNIPRHKVRLGDIAKRARMHEERRRGDWGGFPTHALSISRDVHASNTSVDAPDMAKNLQLLKRGLSPPEYSWTDKNNKNSRKGRKKLPIAN